MKINPSDLADAVNNQLKLYDKNVAKAIKKTVEDVAKETKDVIDSHMTFNDISGKYRDSVKLTTLYEDDYKKMITWHVSGKEYRLTHLLEKGHATRNGKRTRKFPHIKYGDEYVKKELPKRIEEAIKKNG
ncbi:MAG: hypothetical protein MJ245_07530 [Clostridia bacterium]|nr:hypothetical protein [Clostridia bacterium]